MDSLRDVEEFTRTTSLVYDPAKSGDGSDRSSDELDHEEVLEAGGWNQEQRQLNDPEEKVGDHPVCGDASAFGESIGYPIVRGPDCFTVSPLQGSWERAVQDLRTCCKHDGNALSTICTLNTQPEHGQDSSRDDTEVSEVVSETRSNDDREGNVKLSTDGPVENHGDSHTRCTDNHLCNGQACARIVREQAVKHTTGIASFQFNPTAMTEEAVSQVPRLTVSVAQYAIQVQSVHV